MAHARFAEVELLGFSAPNPEATHWAGDHLSLTLLWQAQVQPATDLRLALWLEGEQDAALTETTVGGRFPPSQWQEEQVVRQSLLLPLPADLPAGRYQLKMRLTRDGQPVPWGWGIIPRGSDLGLGSIDIRP
jgi:hypothetical protein